jgi:hypothetical protein
MEAASAGTDSATAPSQYGMRAMRARQCTDACLLMPSIEAHEQGPEVAVLPGLALNSF